MFNISISESTLHLVLRLRGGAKKRKKKNYTTPKKQKHKHKKVKLAVLKYYRVDDNGKINRLRRECPSEECGAGIFMAAHFDRQYCGKCGLTYVYNPIEEKWLSRPITRLLCTFTFWWWKYRTLHLKELFWLLGEK